MARISGNKGEKTTKLVSSSLTFTNQTFGDFETIMPGKCLQHFPANLTPCFPLQNNEQNTNHFLRNI